MLAKAQGYRFQHPAGPVDDGEWVLEGLLGDWQWAHDVYVDVGDLLLRHWDGPQGGGVLAGHFRPGAGLAFLNPLCHILVHAGC